MRDSICRSMCDGESKKLACVRSTEHCMLVQQSYKKVTMDFCTRRSLTPAGLMEPRTLAIPLALLTFVILAANASGLYFTIEPQDVVVEQGNPARLDCEANSSFGKPNIQWRTDDGQPINFIGDSYRSQLSNGSLYINSVYGTSLELTGSYQCLASVDDIGAIVSRIATIKIASLPGFEKEPQDTMVYPGQIAYLSCTLLATSSSLIIQWLKDEHPLIISMDSRMTILPSGALEIDNVKTEDVGSYRCNASSYGQYRLSNKAQLGLLSDIDQESTPPVFIAKPLQQVIIEGSTITLECAANGYPKPSILWLKDGVAIDLTSFKSRYSRIAASSLVISNVEEIDNGSYQCRAENEVEILDATADLIVQVPPRFIKKPEDKIASENQDLEFECEIYGKPQPKITWLKNGERITLSAYWQIVNGYNLRINGLLPIDAGIFQCIGTNSAGTVQAAARLTINQPKKAISHKSTTPKTVPKKKLLLHRQLYNKTWQHPSTLLGHTMSAFTPNPPLSISPSDDPADLPGSVRFPNSHYDPKSPFIDDTDSLESIEGSVPSAPRNLSLVIVTARFVTLRWQEPENTNGEILNYYIYYKQEGAQRERVINTQQKLEAVIRGLQPSMTYHFRVVALNERGSGISSEILQVTTLTEANVPGPPLNLEGYATSSVSIALSWEEPQVTNGKISKYIITFVEGDNEEITRETTSTMHDLIDLVPYTEYSIKVQAVNENGPGVFSRDIVVRTYSAQPTQPPHNVTVEPVSPTSIMIRWEPPLEGQNGIITGYKIRYRRHDRASPPVNIATEGNQRSRVLTGLEKHVVYQVRICALNVNGTGPWTEWIQIETYETESDENRVPNTPSNLRTKVMSDYIQVFWNPPKDQSIKVKGYKLGWGKGVPDVEVRLLDGKERSFTIDQLEPITEYVISLRATNDAGDGQPAYANVRTTERSVSEFSAPLLPPVGLKASVLSDTTVVLYWTDTTLPKTQFVTDNRYYVVRYTSHHHSSNPRYKYHNATDLNCMINDLKPNTLYEFTVKLVKGKRESLWSMVVSNQTQEAAPSSAPRNLTIQSIEDRPTSVLLRWQPPKQPNGPITGYIIFYSIDNTKWDRDWLIEGVIGDKTEFIVKGLQPSMTYYFKIQARNSKGYGPFSTTYPFKTPQSSGMDVYDELHDRDGRGLSNILIYIIVGCSIVLVTGIAVVVVVICCKRSPDTPDRKKGYMKDTNQKTNIKPPDLWIHHDQMELKALEKSSINGEASTSGVASNTLPRSNNQEYNQENVHGNSSSLDKRTYVPSYMAIATATPIVNTSMSQPTIHTSCNDTPSARQNYPRTVAQYSLSRAHITLEPTPESSPDSCNISTSYEPMQNQQLPYGTSSQSYSGNTQYASGHYSNSNQPSNTSSGTDGASGSKRMQGHPLKSFSVPAPPPQSAPSTPAQQKHGVSQVTVRPTMSGSPYKKPQSSAQLAKNRLASVSNPVHTSEEVERLKPSYSTEELNQEMANLEGLMKDLNAITASEFEC
ncbi:neogenin isoform X5 [Apis mellifera]|uniref:Neogenin isoform X5 n=1 Tax=Apis mellifera TaxID=7460 RepID=A0A7M7LRZ0_APIME|nr:neogenin isoform X5 [Apis mellifera]|eukprot:XP_006565869.1 neogenin isoform X5 [Apis mellifera]